MQQMDYEALLSSPRLVAQVPHESLLASPRLVASSPGGYSYGGEAKDSLGDHSPTDQKHLSVGVGIHHNEFISAPHLDRTSPSQVDRMLTLMDQKVSKVQQAEQSKLQMISEQTQRLVEGLQSMAVSREILDERKTKELRMIENSLALDLNVVRQARKDAEAKCDKVMENHVGEMQNDLHQVRTMRERSFEEYDKEVADEVQRLKNELEGEKTRRDSRSQEIESHLESELGKVREAVSQEQKIRFDAEGAMLRMLEDMCVRMRGEIANERKERETMQGTLLGLLEETCQRIEHSYHVNPPASPPQQSV